MAADLMNVITHALLPMIVGAPLLGMRSAGRYSRASVVAASGALPDLIHPHLSLTARYSSWPHSLFALGAFAVVMAIASRSWSHRFPRRLSALAVVGYALHLGGDAISGGIAWLYPASPDVIGTRMVPYAWWFLLDVVAGFAVAVLYWVVPADRAALPTAPATTRSKVLPS